MHTVYVKDCSFKNYGASFILFFVKQPLLFLFDKMCYSLLQDAYVWTIYLSKAYHHFLVQNHI